MPREYLIDDDDVMPDNLPDVPYGAEPDSAPDESEDK